MGTVQAGGSGHPGGLGAVVHDLRSALSASTAYLDLAQERLERGEAVEPEDLSRVAKGLERLAAAVEALDRLARAPRGAAE